MSSTLHKRKRSRAAGLTAIGAVSMLAGCSSGPSEEELSRSQFGEATEVSMFRSAAECAAIGEFNLEQCTAAEQTAWNEDPKSAPRFEDQADCEDQFGNGNCRSGGTGYFMPIMTGFMIGRLMSGGSRYRYAGLYRDERDDAYYSGSGAWLHKKKSKSGKYLVGSKAFMPFTQAVQTRSAIASRGGFGGRASMSRGGGGGWGG